ncbi:hypothetical protein T03_9188 [Trichinella britovi]|uniref:Uncharacterized protein n=1 Tax=Trichinella britovi TaxID=45882 RepID=A0A0V1CET0_TRIBR|nr:hypothetical protein T03_9188 [Trichinella britovi]
MKLPKSDLRVRVDINAVRYSTSIHARMHKEIKLELYKEDCIRFQKRISYEFYVLQLGPRNSPVTVAAEC